MLLANRSPQPGSYRPALLGTLAALVFAAHCAGAPGIPAVNGLSTSSSGSGGFIFAGTRMWVSDATRGLCRMDPNGGGGGGGAAFSLSNCVLPTTSSPATVHAVLGQPAFDPATNFVYVPDMSTASLGIWRYSFNGSTFGGAVNIASTAGLGAQRPGAIALGDDGNIYASMTANSRIVRVVTPSAATQTVQSVTTTLSGSPARGLVFVSTQLWIADTDGEIVIPGASVCGTKCRGAINAQTAITNPLSITWDAVNSFVYVGTSSGVFRINRLTGQADLYSKFWQSLTTSGLLTNVTAVGVDNLGNLFYIDDPTASQSANASAYTVAANSAPDGQGTIATPPSTILPIQSSLPAFANPALLYSSGLTTPRGAVWMGGSMWVVDATLGFCKIIPTLAAPSLTACAVLPIGFAPGGPAYDSAGHFV